MISNLLQIGRLDLLQRVYRHVLLPPAVLEELRRSHADDSTLRSAFASWLEVRAPGDEGRVAALASLVDAGEAAAIVLACEIPDSLLLIDDSAGRVLARSMGVQVTGLVGTLLRAKVIGIIPRLRPALDDLANLTSFRMSASLRLSALREAGESTSKNP